MSERQPSDSAQDNALPSSSTDSVDQNNQTNTDSPATNPVASAGQPTPGPAEPITGIQAGTQPQQSKSDSVEQQGSASGLSTARQTASRQRSAPKPVEIPRADDVDVNQEIEAALGDMSLMDLYGLDEQADAASAATGGAKEKTEKAPEGIRSGYVVSVSRDGVFVELGGKSQGLLPLEELEEGEEPVVGSEIKVAIVNYDRRDGLLLLSRKTAEQQLLVSNLAEGVLVEGRVVGTNKGGLELDIKGLKAFMPISQIDLGRVEDLEPYMGEKMVCEVTQVERGDKDIVVSRRNVLMREREEQRDHAWTEIEEGQLKHGVVRSLMDYGAFVDIGGVDGLLHVREMSWAHVKHPKDILTVGQGIDVVVVGVDREKQRIALSLRQAGGDPWTTAEHKYPVGSRHQAQIKNLADFGAFAELESGIDGLIPISQMTWAGRIRHPSDVVQSGMMVEVEIMSIDVAKRRISLSMKNLQENPWANITSRYAPDQIHTGTVARVTDFGAFVTLEPGVDGLVHISEMAAHRVNHASDVVKEGQEVQVKILSVDTAEQRIALSIKGVHEHSGGASFESSEIGHSSVEPSGGTPEKKDKKKKDRPRRGGLS